MAKRFGMDFFRSVCYNKTRVHTTLFRMVPRVMAGSRSKAYHRKMEIFIQKYG